MTKNNFVKNSVYNSFMICPIPSWITTLKDGTFVAINEAGVRYIGLKREDIIGRSTIELGLNTIEGRKAFIEEIEKYGISKNIPVTLKVKDQIIRALFAVYKFRQGKEDLLFGFLHSIPNYKPQIENSDGDLFYKLALLDLKFIRDRLKQYDLTARQKDITTLAAGGKSNKDIARELFISEYTVKDHLKQIFRTIGIHNRSELVPRLLNLD